MVTITYDLPPIASVKAATRTTSGLKEYAHYKKADQLLWMFQVHGSFEYDGSSADYFKDICDSARSFVCADAYCSGASAVANGSFNDRIVNPVERQPLCQKACKHQMRVHSKAAMLICFSIAAKIYQNYGRLISLPSTVKAKQTFWPWESA